MAKQETKIGPGRAETRKNAAYAKRLKDPRRKRGMGTGKRALAGNRFKQLHVNWFKRIAKEMIQNKHVQAIIKSGKLDWALK